MLSNQSNAFGSNRCSRCDALLPISHTDAFCEPCKGKNNLFRFLGWAGVAGFSLVLPPIGGVMLAGMTAWENSMAQKQPRKRCDGLIWDPNPKYIYDISNHLWMKNKQLQLQSDQLRLKESENSFLCKEIDRLKQENLFLLARDFEQKKLVRQLHTETSISWLHMAHDPKHYGIQRLERVKISTRLEYSDYRLLTDIFIPDPECKGLLHGGIPVGVIQPMIEKASIQKFTYSFSSNQLSNPIDIIY